MTRSKRVPLFDLYGEPHRVAAERFVHVESLHDRSRPNKWVIAPHTHARLSHLFLITRGGGELQAEETVSAFGAPALLVIPAGVVHGFRWHWESRGLVVTLANTYLDDLVRRDSHIQELLRSPRAIPLTTDDRASLQRAGSLLKKELNRPTRGYRAAVDSAVLSMTVTALRRTEHLSDVATVTPGRQAALVARLRERIEKSYRRRESVSLHAKALGVSVTALRTACARVVGMPPVTMLDQRSLLEAKRSLLYSNRSIAEVGYDLGFVDAAYFSRWFRRLVGQSPRHYRTQHGL